MTGLSGTIAGSDVQIAFELGFTPAVATILSLGPQNTLVLRQGLSRRHVMLAVGICHGCDLVLITFAVLGLAVMLGMVPAALLMLRILGACFLVLASARLFMQAVGEGHLRDVSTRRHTRHVVLAALAVSLLNPLAWIETCLVIGAISSTVKVNLLIVFAVGAALGSLCRLSLLGYGARMLTPLFRWPPFRRGFDTLAGMVMAGMALALVLGLAD